MSQSLDKLIAIMAILRGPEGCPWDHEQTHESIIAQLIEETYELVEAIESKNDPHFCEELGDLLLHVVFQAQMASERGAFDIDTVAEQLSEKLVRRHPHVFGKAKVKNAKEVMVSWDEIKARENKKHKGTSYLDSVPKGLPALFQAHKLSKKASKIGFDWKKTKDVMMKVDEELMEIKEAVSRKNKKDLEHEVGDFLFALSNLCRFLKIQPEEALRKANTRFRKRFAFMEEKIKKRRKKFSQITLKQWDQLWNMSKKAEKAESKSS